MGTPGNALRWRLAIYPIPTLPMTPGQLAHTGIVVLPIVCVAVASLLLGFLAVRAAARRSR